MVYHSMSLERDSCHPKVTPVHPGLLLSVQLIAPAAVIAFGVRLDGSVVTIVATCGSGEP